jgi:hypothetical protein
VTRRRIRRGKRVWAATCSSKKEDEAGKGWRVGLDRRSEGMAAKGVGGWVHVPFA